MQALKRWGLLGGACLLLWGAGVVGCEGFSAESPTCAPDETVCDGECFHLSIDPRHCGACGVRCTGSSVCRDGTCRMVCDYGTTECDGACVYLASDFWNCGTCGHACDPGEYCGSGSCLPGPGPSGSGSSSRGSGSGGCNGCNEPYPHPPGPAGPLPPPL
jgi:hypothetical protein